MQKWKIFKKSKNAKIDAWFAMPGFNVNGVLKKIKQELPQA